jgi:hypothetical protein
MARFGEKSKLIEILRENPLVSFACKKVGLHRTTFYRWHRDDKSFRDKVDEALGLGRKGLCDGVEAGVIKMAREGNLRASIFILQHNHPLYRPVRTTYVEPIHDHHDLRPGEVCRSCGHHEPAIEDYEKAKKSKKSKKDNAWLANELHKRLRFDGDKKTKDEIRKIIDDFVRSNNMTNEITFVDFSKERDSDGDPPKA